MVKIRLLFLFFLALFVAVCVKLFFIQVIASNAKTTDYVSSQKLTPERGKIFDRLGVPLAINQTTYRLFVEPKKIESKDDLIAKIDDVLHIGEATLESRIDMSKDWVSVKTDIDQATKEKLQKKIPVGIGFDDDPKRFYPEASLSAHILGFVGKNSKGDNVGYFGIEGFYDQELEGLAGFLKSERDLLNRPIFFGVQERVESQDGRDLYLTIDSAVQAIVKKKLQAALESYQAQEGCVIVADPYTMEIIALSCLPDFDPDTYYSFDEKYFKNSSISNLYEPGSTFKPLIVGAALKEKAITPDEIYDEQGPVKIGEYKIQTWNNQYEGKINITRILEKSSNVGMVYVGKKLGNDKLYKYIQNYGFGKTTGIDLQGEEGGYLKAKKLWYPIDFATATFGQGIAVTPIQMVRAFSALINGGNLLKPYIVKKTVDGDVVKERQPQVERKILDEKTSAIIKKMLVSTVEHGEFQWVKPKGYIMGGKTGTAQIPIAGHYDPNKTVASFIGFAPADKPKFIALTVLKEPKSSIWGSETAAPLFFDIAKDLMVYYNIPPDQN